MLTTDQTTRIIEESKRYSFSYLGYPFDHVMLTSIATLDFKGPDALSMLGFVLNLVGTYDLTKLKMAFRKHQNIFTSTIARKDVMLRMEKMVNDVPDSIIVPLYSFRTKRLIISLPLLIKAASIVRHTMKNYHGFKAYLYFTGFLYRYMWLYRLLDHVFSNADLRGKAYMGLSSSTFDDVVFTEFFKRKGATTYHFTHAINFVDFAIHPVYEFIAPYNITADNILVWGKSSITDIKVVFPHLLNRRILIGGNNLMPDKEIRLHHSFTKCLVLLTVSSYYKENVSLLYLLHEVAQEKPNIRFYIKPHPTAPLGDIPKICRELNLEMVDRSMPTSVSMDSDKFDFAISNQTNAYYDAIYHNLPCFRYAENENVQYLGMDDKFKSCSELIKKIQEFKEMPENELNQKARDVLVNVTGMGINHYSEIFRIGRKTA